MAASKNFREIIRQYHVETHVGDDKLFVLGVQSDPSWFLDLALGSADEPAGWDVATVIDAPYTHEYTLRLLLLVLARLRGDNPTLGWLYLNLVDPDNPGLRALNDPDRFNIAAVSAVENQESSSLPLIHLALCLSGSRWRPGACRDNHVVDWIDSERLHIVQLRIGTGDYADRRNVSVAIPGEYQDLLMIRDIAFVMHRIHVEPVYLSFQPRVGALDDPNGRFFALS